MRSTWIAALLTATLAPAFAGGDQDIEYKPLQIAALQELGILKSGRFGGAPVFKDEWTDHVGAFLTQEVQVGEHLTLRVGLGGILEFQKPENISPSWGGDQYRDFFVGPTIADFEYRRDLGPGAWSIGMGMFPFKYNPDAANLGEYLFRSGPYPNYIWSGGYAYVGANQAYLQGLRSRFTSGNFSADVLLLTETTIPPLYDLSLASILKYTAGGGLLELTGGVNFKRLVPIHPSKTKRQVPNNAYFTMHDKSYTGKISYYSEHAQFYRAQADSAGVRAAAARAAGASFDAFVADSVAWMAKYQVWKNDVDSVRLWTGPANPNPPAYGYYSQSGIIGMLAASLDFKKILPAGPYGPNDMRLFAEVALLGFKDYPIFYEKKSERMPIMLGFNLPGFKFFDLISVQVEQYKSPWLNSYEESEQTNQSTPYIPFGTDPAYSRNDFKDVTDDDNLYWSILVRKQLMAGLFGTVQVARDHIRSVSSAAWAGPAVDPNEIFYSKKNWYWMLQFSFGI